jgi:hypothetical protein
MSDSTFVLCELLFMLLCGGGMGFIMGIWAMSD